MSVPPVAASPPAEGRTSRLDLRLTPTEEAFIHQAAAARRQSVTEFMSEAAIAAANRAVEETRRVVLTNEAFDRLVDDLDEPGQVIPALAQLVQQPRRFKLPD